MINNLQQNSKYRDFWDLSKPDITLLVIITAFFGYYAGIVSMGINGDLNWMDVFYLLIGVALSSAGVSTLNGYLESHLDKQMNRTSNRPIPSGRVSSMNALIFGLAVSIIGVIDLYVFISPLAGYLSLLTLWCIWCLKASLKKGP